jgi:dephospho-CoA kinase
LVDRVDKAGPAIIGVVGGIGSGKSAVARVFESLGAAVIDSDRLNHEQLAAPDVVAQLRAWWGSRVCDKAGGIDRKAVAGIVFDDPAALAALQDLVYPRIARRRDELIARYRADPAVRAIVLDTPKLFEAGLERICDAVVFVDAPRARRLERVYRSRGWTEAELDRRENLLDPLDKKQARADYTVVNDSDIDELRPSIERILSTIIESR